MFLSKMVENTVHYLIRRRVRDGDISIIKGPKDTSYIKEANERNRESRAPIRYVWHSGNR